MKCLVCLGQDSVIFYGLCCYFVYSPPLLFKWPMIFSIYGQSYVLLIKKNKMSWLKMVIFIALWNGANIVWLGRLWPIKESRKAVKSIMFKIWKLDSNLNIIEGWVNLFIFELSWDIGMANHAWLFGQCLVYLQYFDDLTQPSTHHSKQTFLWVL